MLEALLQMNEGPGALNQPLEEVGVWRRSAEPKLLKDIVRFVLSLFVPAAKKREIIRVLFDVCLV